MTEKEIIKECAKIFGGVLINYGYDLLKSKSTLKKKMKWGYFEYTFVAYKYKPKYHYTFMIKVFHSEANKIANETLKLAFQKMGRKEPSKIINAFRISSDFAVSGFNNDDHKRFIIYSLEDIRSTFDNYIRDTLIGFEENIMGNIESIKDIAKMFLEGEINDPVNLPGSKRQVPMGMIALKLAGSDQYDEMVEKWRPYFGPQKGDPGYVGREEHCLEIVEYLKDFSPVN